ncbi:MAG: hypothetical protein ACKO23_21375 [Gemmataceae bacterium]
MGCRPPFGLVMLLTLLISDPLPAQTPGKDKGKPKSLSAIPGYKKHTMQGFTLLINNAVYENNEDPKWKRQPLDVLDLELGTVVRRLPDRAVKALQTLLIWVEWEDLTDPDLEKGAVAKYYGVMGNLALWSLGQNKHPLKANNVEIINMKSLTREHQPGVKTERCVILHEMAHAVHHQVFGFNNKSVQNAYTQAMNRRLYDEAVDVYGRTLRPPYASRNPMEYFAEMSCAYLDKLHYYPFTVDDLKKHDPVGYRMMELTWGTRKMIDSALTAKSEKEANRKLEQARAQNALNRSEDARRTLEMLIHTFPQSKAAVTARKWMENWNGPGAPKTNGDSEKEDIGKK